MKIMKNSIVRLEDGKEYLIVSLEKLEGIRFCLISTLQPPIEMKVVEIIEKENISFLQKYTGGDYKYILKRLLEKSASEIS